MKPASHWLNQVGETVMLSAFAGSKPPGNEIERLVEQIQADALHHASLVVEANKENWGAAINDLMSQAMALSKP